MANNKESVKRNKRNPKGNSDRKVNSKSKWNSSNPSTKDNPVTSKFDGGNDPTWYSRSPELVNASASLAFPYAIGTTYRFPGDQILNIWNETDEGFFNPFTVPGIMTVDYVPTLGHAQNAASPINVAARAIYAFIRKSNSGAKNYEPADVMIYLMCLDSIYMALANAKRAYGVSLHFSQTNYYKPEGIIEALGFEPFNDKLPAVYGRINFLLNKVGSLAAPASMPYFLRHEWLASHVWTDSMDESKAQIMAYVPRAFVKYAPFEEESGGRADLIWMARYLGKGDNTFSVDMDAYLDVVEWMIESMMEDEDCGIISGDIIKAFEGNVINIAPMDQTYSVPVEYSLEVVSQIRNVVALPEDIVRVNFCNDYVDGLSLGYVRQENSVLKTNMTWNESTAVTQYSNPTGRFLASGLFLNFDWAKPTPDDVMVATRLMPAITCMNLDTTNLFQVSEVGSEIAVGITVWTTDNQRNFIRHEIPSVCPAINALSRATLLTQFNFYPRVYVYENMEGSDSVWRTHRIGMIGDVNTYTIINAEQISLMHRAALMSEFAVPALGLYNP